MRLNLITYLPEPSQEGLKEDADSYGFLQEDPITGSEKSLIAR